MNNKSEEKNSMIDRPLITFALISYNQEKFIKEALDGVFSQTYSPLQIILSDDNSTDKTFDIMEEEVKKYAKNNTTNKVILNRNPKNLGIGGHINKVMTLVEGDLIVIAAGDDISLPERVEIIYSTWEKHNFPRTSIHSAYYEIDEKGNNLGVNHALNKSGFNNLSDALKEHFSVHGASHAWHKDVFSVFGPIRNDVVYEDRVIPIRSMLLSGEIIYIESPLIKYRTTVGISGSYATHTFKEALFGLRAEKLLIAHKQQLTDIQMYLGGSATTRIVKNLIKRQEFILEFRQDLTIPKRTNLIIKAYKNSIGIKLILRALLVYYTPYLFKLILLMQNKLTGKQ